MSDYHIAVLLKESVDLLDIKEDGFYVDVTFGAGGHSKEILSRLGPNGKLMVFDQDHDALQNKFEDPRLIFVKSNFRYLKHFLKYYKVDTIDGLLADLGVSSFQFDQAERGFSYRFESELDMRMNQEMDMKASDILQEYSMDDLVRIFSEYGEVRNSKTLARKIVEARNHIKTWTTQNFNQLLEQNKFGSYAKYFAQVYQALRIEVNDEMTALADLLSDTQSHLSKNGRLVVISYHSIEDRLVKNMMKAGNPKGKMVSDDFGNIERPYKILTKQVIVAGDGEQKRNSRSRSAKLRAAIKL